MSSFTLYGNRESGHTYKVRLMLELSGIPYDYTAVNLDVPRNERPEPFRSLAKYGEVPLLVHAGRPYVQSNAILIYLAEHASTYGGESPELMERVREWLFWEANRIGFSLPNLRWGKRFTPGGMSADVEALLRGRYNADIARLDAEFADGRAFILGERPTIADFSLCGYMFWPEQADVAYPAHVAAWLGRIASLPGWNHPYDLKG